MHIQVHESKNDFTFTFKCTMSLIALRKIWHSTDHHVNKLGWDEM